MLLPTRGQVFRLPLRESGMVKDNLCPSALFHELEPDNRIDPSIPAANAPSLDDQLVRHEFNMSANDVPAKQGKRAT
jgi:hypothetical protein